MLAVNKIHVIFGVFPTDDRTASSFRVEAGGVVPPIMVPQDQTCFDSSLPDGFTMPSIRDRLRPLYPQPAHVRDLPAAARRVGLRFYFNDHEEPPTSGGVGVIWIADDDTLRSLLQQFHSSFPDGGGVFVLFAQFCPPEAEDMRVTPGAVALSSRAALETQCHCCPDGTAVGRCAAGTESDSIN